MNGTAVRCLFLVVSSAEHALQCFQLIDRLPKNQIPALLKVFDSSHSGSISYEDFLRFVESAREDEDDGIALDDDDEGDGGAGTSTSSNLNKLPS